MSFGLLTGELIKQTSNHIFAMRIMNYLFRVYCEIVKTISPIKHARLIGVKIGNNCLVYRNVEWPSEPYLITIGNNVQLTSGVSIYTHGGANVVRCIDSDFDVFGKVVIKDFAYIGSHSLILPGVTIGEGAMVAAGSVVTKSVPDGMVVGGNPAKILCPVKDYYERNKIYNLSSKKLPLNKKKMYLLSIPD